MRAMLLGSGYGQHGYGLLDGRAGSKLGKMAAARVGPEFGRELHGYILLVEVGLLNAQAPKMRE